MQDVAGLLCINHEAPKRVLLVFKDGWWFFPGGKRELGEDLLSTLSRELFEELGLIMRGVPSPIHHDVFPVRGGVKSYHFHTYMATENILQGVPRLRPQDTVTQYAWVDDPLGLNLTAHARFIIKKFM